MMALLPVHIHESVDRTNWHNHHSVNDSPVQSGSEKLDRDAGEDESYTYSGRTTQGNY